MRPILNRIFEFLSILIAISGCGGGGQSVNDSNENAAHTSLAGSTFIAGKNEVGQSIVEGVGNAAFLGSTYGGKTVLGAQGNIYLGLGTVVLEITPSGSMKKLVGIPGAVGTVDGVGQQARISGVVSLVRDVDGGLLLLEATGNIRKIDPTRGSIVTIVNIHTEHCGFSGDMDPILEGALPGVCWYPKQLSLDVDGNWIISDESLIRSYNPVSGVVKIVAGTWVFRANGRVETRTYGSGPDASIAKVNSLVVEPRSGDYFIIEASSLVSTGLLKRVTPAGQVSLVLGHKDLQFGDLVASGYGKLYTRVGNILEIDPIGKAVTAWPVAEGSVVWSLGFDPSGYAFFTIPWSTLWKSNGVQQ